MSEAHSVQQRIVELEETLAMSLPDSVRHVLQNELTTLREQQQDPTTLFNAGLCRHTKRVLVGTASAFTPRRDFSTSPPSTTFRAASLEMTRV